jgi:hypothetical protein
MDVVNAGLTIGVVLIAGFLIYGLEASPERPVPQKAFVESANAEPIQQAGHHANPIRLNARF